MTIGAVRQAVLFLVGVISCHSGGSPAGPDGPTGPDVPMATPVHPQPTAMALDSSAPSTGDSSDPMARVPLSQGSLTYIDVYGLTYPMPSTVEKVIFAGLSRPSDPINSLTGRPSQWLAPPGLGTFAGARARFLGRKPARALCLVRVSTPDMPLDRCLGADAGIAAVLVAGDQPVAFDDERAVARVDDATWAFLTGGMDMDTMCLSRGRPKACPSSFDFGSH